MTIVTFTEPLPVTDRAYLALLARLGGFRLVDRETQERVRYYVHRSEVARITSNFYRYVHAERRLR